MWSIAGKTVLVTGATHGLGLESACVLAGLGAQVVIVGRRQERIAASIRMVELRAGVRPRAYCCDFASLRDVAALGEALLRELPALHVLINNAGAVFARRTLTTDGVEATFAVNHLAPFLLTSRLRSLLVSSAPARVITVASGRHFKGTMNFEDLGFARGYQVLRAYGRSKLANVLFATELSRRLEGTGVTSNSVHPGRVATNIWSGAPAWTKPLISLWLSRTFLSVDDGAAPIVSLAAKPELAVVTSEYFDRFDRVSASPLARDTELATRLWDESERLCRAAIGA
jgi:NAD(P)-dependent dehydrogenase (short-subunit alcohol dehydrogenase family)